MQRLQVRGLLGALVVELVFYELFSLRMAGFQGA